MNAIEQEILATIRGTGRSGRYRVRVGGVEVWTSAKSEADAIKRAKAWHARHTSNLSKHGLRHVEYVNPAVTVR